MAKKVAKKVAKKAPAKKVAIKATAKKVAKKAPAKKKAAKKAGPMSCCCKEPLVANHLTASLHLDYDEKGPSESCILAALSVYR